MDPATPSSVPSEFALLVTALGGVPDFRKRQGKLHPLSGTLALVVLGLMAGSRSLSAIRRFGRCHPEVLDPLGLRAVPSVATLSRILAGVEPATVRTALRVFAASVVAARHVAPTVVAMDGKALRGVYDAAEPALLLHLFAQQSAIVLDQVAVGPLRDEVRAAETWITTLAEAFPGLAVLTADALYADRDLCAAIVAQEYAYLLRLKKTSPSC
jgi:hypothetical protein